MLSETTQQTTGTEQQRGDVAKELVDDILCRVVDLLFVETLPPELLSEATEALAKCASDLHRIKHRPRVTMA